MIPVDTDSPSLILHASHILLIRLEGAEIGQWTVDTTNPALKRRPCRLDIRLLDVLKGRMKEEPGARFDVEVTQSATTTGRLAPMPGVWSDRPLSGGTEWLAFSSGPDGPAARLVEDPACLMLTPASSQAGVRLAVRAEEEPKMNAAEACAAAASMARDLDDIFADYLWSRWGEEAMRDPKTFEEIARLIENPNLAGPARAMLIDKANSELAAVEPTPIPQVARMAKVLFLLLSLRAATDLHDEIIENDLPSLLNLESAGHPRKAADLFRGDPKGREMAEKALRDYKGSASTATLVKWLREAG
jgi:hypothetical protein